MQRAAQKLAGYSLGQADLLRRAMGKKKKEILDKEFVPFRDGMREQRLLRRGDQGALGRPGPVRRLRLQQGAHRRATAWSPTGPRYLKAQLPGRVHGRAAHQRRRRQGQDGALPGRVPADGHQGAAAGRQRLRRAVHPGRQGHPLRPGRGPQRRRATWSTRSSRCRAGEGRRTPTSTTSCPRWTRSSATRRRSNR